MSATLRSFPAARARRIQDAWSTWAVRTDQFENVLADPRDGSGGVWIVSSFAAAPTERFLRRMQELQSLPPEIRRGIARRVADEIRPLLGKRAAAAVRELRGRAQDERWRLLSQGIRNWSDDRFGPVALSEQWAIARLEIIDGAHPIREILAERRMRAIEAFLRDSLAERGDDA